MKTVLFALNGSYSHTSLAVRAIGASLQKHGVETVIIEKNLSDTHHAVLHELYLTDADVYGFSAYIWNITEMLRFAAELREIRPRAVIVFGGPEVSFMDESFFTLHPYIDHIIAGEGEDAFPQFCVKLARGETPPKITMAMPFADFCESGIYYGEIGAEPHGLVYYESVRGCPFSCAYCLSSRGDGIRAKTAEKALADLLAFEQFDDIRTVKLVDRTFNFDRERAKTIWRALLGEKYTNEYHFEVSAALLDEESFRILEAAPKGKFRLEIGVQSTNPETIRAVARALDTEKTLAALKRLSKKGNLHVHADLIAGLPHEDYESFGRSFDDVYGACDVLQLGFLKLLHGSAMRRDAAKYGIRFSPVPPYQVLRTDMLSFEDIMRLEAIDALNDRFSGSGKFANTFPFLPLESGSAFQFFEGLSAFLTERFHCKEIKRLPQTEAFRLVYEYAVSVGLPEKETRERLALDFLLGETRRLPPFLHTETVGSEERGQVLSEVHPSVRSACEVVRFGFLSEHPAVIDRVRKTVTIMDNFSVR